MLGHGYAGAGRPIDRRRSQRLTLRLVKPFSVRPAPGRRVQRASISTQVTQTRSPGREPELLTLVGSTVITPAHGRSLHGHPGPPAYHQHKAGLGPVTPGGSARRTTSRSARRHALRVGEAIPTSYRGWPLASWNTPTRPQRSQGISPGTHGLRTCSDLPTGASTGPRRWADARYQPGSSAPCPDELRPPDAPVCAYLGLAKSGYLDKLATSALTPQRRA